MEREANYVAVGAFILLVMAMAVAFVLWYTDANDQRDYDLYEIYFTGSVSGLDRGSPVRYLGVDVGRVRRLSIDRRDASRIVAVAKAAECWFTTMKKDNGALPAKIMGVWVADESGYAN